MFLRNMNNKDNEKVFELGLNLFRDDDEIPLFKSALSFYVKELSYVIVDNGNNGNNGNNDNIVGFALVCKKMTHIYKKFMTGIPNCYELSFFGVNPEYQGKGYGSQCLRITLSSIYRECINFNCWLIVDKINNKAIKMYQNYGFRKWFEIYDKYPSYIMGLSYRRWRILKN
jgi:ribosomal protein S18 acetylase RimI-like enzyme